MSELKAKHIVDVYDEYSSNPYNEAQVYLKSEADKAIAELEEKHKTEVKELLCLIRDKENNFNRAFDSEEKEIRHHKYKRCLAMAKLCHWKMGVFIYKEEKSNFYHRWFKRWLKIADQLKGAK